MTTLVIYGSRTTEAACRELAATQDSCVVFEIDERLPADLLLPNCLVRTFEDYLGEPDYETIDSYVVAFVERGLRLDGEDLTEWRGVSLASAIRSEIYLGLTSIVKTAVCVDRIVEQHQPDKILVGDGVGLLRDVWQREASLRGIDSELLTVDPPLTIEPEWVNAKLRRKQAGASSSHLLPSARRVAGAAKRTCLRLARPVSLRRDPRVFTGRIGDRKLLAELASSPVLSARPIAGAAPAVVRWLAGVGSVRRVREAFRARWAAYANASDSLHLRLDGIDLWPHMRDWLADLFQSVLPRHAALVPAIQADVRVGRPRVLIQDGNRSSKSLLYTQIGRDQGASIVLRWNEWTGGAREVHRPPIDADWILCWGKYSADYFVRRGIPRERVIEVGKMGVDEFALPSTERQGSLRRELSIPPGAPIALYADQSYQPSWAAKAPLDYTTRNLDRLVAAASVLPGVWFLVRVHPKLGMNDVHEPPDAIQRRVNRLRQAGLPNILATPLHYSLEDCFAIADLFMSSYSTTAVEAMLHGLPVLLLNFTGKSGYWPDLASRRGPIETTDVDSLVDAVKSLATQSGERSEVLAAQHKYLTKLFSPTVDMVSVLEELVTSEAIDGCADARLVPGER
ncbi:hypothetical protein KJ567_06495 [Candidatus Bipolaricaulota bacterium]|nr:hypothetical protein [Candidatus Bipolaricaulota bacterium]